MKYHVNLMIAKKQGLEEGIEKGIQKGIQKGELLNQISQIRTIYLRNLSLDKYADIFDIDLSIIEQIQQLITQHPDWNDEQIYDALYSKVDD